MQRRVEWLLLSWWAGGLTAVVTILAGAASSFFGDEIQQTFLVVWTPSTAVAWKATAFWLLVACAGLLLGGSQWARSQSALRSRREVDAQVGRLEAAIRRIETLPPEQFLTDHQTILRKAGRSTLVTLAPPVTVALIESAIRNILGCIIQLARQYDGARMQSTYAANLMLYRPYGGVIAVDAHRPFDSTPDSRPTDGPVLELVRALSTTSAMKRFEPDSEVAPLVLRIPQKIEPTKDKDMHERHPVLPGAPWAFVHNEYVGFPTISELDGWLERNSSESTEVIESVRTYFRTGAGARIRSFACMPIQGLGGPTDLPLAVLNIHSDDSGILQEQGGARFSPLSEPFRMLLSILIVSRETAESKQGAQHGKASENGAKRANRRRGARQ